MDLSAIKWNSDGLVPAIAQCAETGAVLMMAWMSEESLKITLKTRCVTYWSRSRQMLWEKGATSGHRQTLKSAKIDCDGDTLVLIVDQIGAACHLGTRTCFQRELRAS